MTAGTIFFFGVCILNRCIDRYHLYPLGGDIPIDDDLIVTHVIILGFFYFLSVTSTETRTSIDN